MTSLDDALVRAAEATIDWAARDAAGHAALQLSHYAIARLHALEEALGERPSARCVVGPDSSPSRNPERLASGFTTGGCVAWEREDLVVLDMLPNCCGMTLARVEISSSVETYFEALSEFAANPPEIDGRRVTVDLNRKNHFMGIFSGEKGDYYAVVHCSAPEYRGSHDARLGLNWVESAALRDRMKLLETPAGPIRYLLGEDAERFLAVAAEAASFAEVKRRLMLERVFGPATEVVYGALHQGYYRGGRVALGAQVRRPGEGTCVFLLGPFEPSYLVGSGPEAVDRSAHGSAFSEAMLPHGGGYSWPDIDDVRVRYDRDSGFLFDLQSGSGTRFITRSLESIPFEYRGRESLDKACEVGMCTVSAKLTPIATLRN